MKKRLAVTGLNAVDSPGPGVPVLRSIQAAGLDLHLIGLSYDVLEPGNFMKDLLEASFLVPYPSAGPAALKERLLGIHETTPIDLILPTLDSELDNYIEIADELRQAGITLILPKKESLDLRDKARLIDGLSGTGIRLPKTIVLGDVPALSKAEEELNFPFFLKGHYYDAHLVRSHDEAIGYFYKISSQWGLPVIAQEYIAGEEQNVATYSVDGELYGAVAMKKMFLTDKGKAWAGVTIDNQEILKTSKEILKHLKWTGGAELEYIIDSKTQTVYLLEINPRFPAWIYLTQAAGLNLPELAVRHAFGESLALKSEYQSGVVFVRHSWDEIIPMEDIANLSATGELKLVQSS